MLVHKQKSSGLVKFLRWGFAGFLALLVAGYVFISICGAAILTSVTDRSLGTDNPSKYGLSYENVVFPTAAGDKLTLRGWWIPNPASQKVIVLVHGRNANRANMLEISRPLWNNGFNLLFFDLRGHGQSDGSTFTFGQKEQWDVIGAVDFVKSRGFKPGSIGVMGWSMGAASSIMAMSQSPDIKALVSDSAYANFAHLADEKFSSTTGLPGFFLPGIIFTSNLLWSLDINQSRPEMAITHLGNRHVFLIHGDQDELVPNENFYKLLDAGGENISDAWLVPGAHHAVSYYSRRAEYVERVTVFFNRELEP